MHDIDLQDPDRGWGRSDCGITVFVKAMQDKSPACSPTILQGVLWPAAANKSDNSQPDHLSFIVIIQ